MSASSYARILFAKKIAPELVKTGDGIPTPREIKTFLDDYVIGQVRAQENSGRRCAQPLQAR